MARDWEADYTLGRQAWAAAYGAAFADEARRCLERLGPLDEAKTLEALLAIDDTKPRQIAGVAAMKLDTHRGGGGQSAG